MFFINVPAQAQDQTDAPLKNGNQSVGMERNDALVLENLHNTLHKATQANDLLLASESYLELALYHLNANDLRRSIEYLNSCLDITVENNFEQQSARCYYLLGLNYDRLSLYDKALDCYFKSLGIRESLNDRKGIAQNFNSIGKVYQHTGDFEDGLSYILKALEIHTALKDERGRMANLLNIGVIHQKKKDFDQALTYYETALDIAVAEDQKEIEAVITGNIGSILVSQGNLKTGLEYLQKALALKEENQNHRRTLHTLNDIAEAKLLADDAEGAREIAEKVVRLAKEYEEGNQLRYGYLNLSKSYEKLRDFEKAYAFLEKYDAVKDSLFGIEKAQLINELQIGYETEKKDQAIKSLQQEREIADFRKKIYFLTGIIVLMILVALYIHQRLKSKRNQALLEKEKEVDRLKSNFFANMSHEFRTPLTLILGPIETMLQDSCDPHQKQQLGIMKKSASRLLRLINQILDLSKLESGHVTLKAKETDIIPVIKGVTGSFKSLADAKDITLTLGLDDPNIPVYFDQAQMETILINLIGNAFKFSDGGGHITVKVREKKNEGGKLGEVEISVADEGKGIPPEQIKHIFDRFYQAGHADASHYGGTGIGLALTKELVELHGGSIVVHSEPGVGTKATVCLPLGKEHLQQTQITEEENKVEKLFLESNEPPVPGYEPLPQSDAQPDQQKPIVLLIEDNGDVRHYIRTLLRHTYTFLEAVDGEDGIEKAKAHIPDLIISDVMMPGMDGYGVCKCLKQEEMTAHIPVILLTAKASVASRIKGHETEADLYLSKPFVPKELLLCIHNLIQSRKKLRERYNKQVVLKPGDIAINSVDELFLERLMKVVEANFEDENFSVDQLGKEMAMSRSQLHRKLQALTNESSSQFIRSFRLQRAMELLKKRNASISEIAFKVGFGSPSYFNRCFLKHYNCTPSSVIESSGVGA